MNSSSANSKSADRPLLIVFALTLVLTLWFTTRSWHATILDRHEFRQLQTAISTYWAREAGFRLDYETPLFGPPWSIPMEFPVYQWIVAGTSRLLGTELEPTARAISLLGFFGTLPAVYALAGLLKLAPARRLLVVSAVLASPTYLFYGRSFMIETTALCFSAWFLYAVTRAVRDLSWRFTALATVCAVLAGLAKVTTLIVFLAPAGLLAWLHWRHRWTCRRDHPGAFWRASLCAIAPVLVGTIVSAWWVRHGDQVKNSNPFSGFLMSSELTSWNWGTWAQRTSGEVWRENWTNLSQFVLGAAPLAVLLFCAALVEPFYRRVAAWCAAFFSSARCSSSTSTTGTITTIPPTPFSSSPAPAFSSPACGTRPGCRRPENGWRCSSCSAGSLGFSTPATPNISAASCRRRPRSPRSSANSCPRATSS
ncbi:MAG: glycosyltransferase family 39 protein [Opitutae bacterium]|nr:glycosyltransferase family 39 protein [Opitutae bacterium]